MKLDDVMTTQGGRTFGMLLLILLNKNCGVKEWIFKKENLENQGKCGLSLDKVWNVYMARN